MDQRKQDRMLLRCLGLGTDDMEAGELEQLSAADWNHMIQQSDKHGAAPLLSQRLKTRSIIRIIMIAVTSLPRLPSYLRHN